MLALGTAAPDFRLPDTGGKMVALGDFKSAPALAVFFICNHCPFVKHIQAGLAQFARDYQARGAARTSFLLPISRWDSRPGKVSTATCRRP